MLAAAGCDLESRDTDGRTPLFSAVANGDSRVVAALVDCGSDVHTRAVSGATPFFQTHLFGTNLFTRSYTRAALLAGGASPYD